MSALESTQSFLAAYQYNPVGGLSVPNQVGDNSMILGQDTAHVFRQDVVPQTFQFAKTLLQHQKIEITDERIINRGTGFILDPDATKLEHVEGRRLVSRALFFRERIASVFIESDARYNPRRNVPIMHDLDEVDDKLLVEVSQDGRNGKRYQHIRMNGDVLMASGRRLVTEREFVERILQRLDMRFADSVDFVRLLISALEAVAGFEFSVENMVIQEGLGEKSRVVVDGRDDAIDSDHLRAFIDVDVPGELHVRVGEGVGSFSARIAQRRQEKTNFPLISLSFDRSGLSGPLPKVLGAISDKIESGLPLAGHYY